MRLLGAPPWVSPSSAGRWAVGWAAATALILAAAGCGTTPTPPPPALATEAPSPVEAPAVEVAPRLDVRVPDGALSRFEVGEARTIPVTVANVGEIPIAVVELRFEGPVRGRRGLLVPDDAGGFRSFGAVPPGETGRFSVGVRAAEPGDGEIRLVVGFRVLAPGQAEGAMREIHLPDEDAEILTEARTYVTFVETLAFTREAAEARVGFRADEALHVHTLDAWVLWRGNDTYVVDVREAVPFEGLSPAAAALLDDNLDDDTVPILDEQGRLSMVPRGPLLRALLEEARHAGWSVTVAEDSGRQVIRVGP
jgi:hypothetical protein